MNDAQKIEQIFKLLKSPVKANQVLAQQLWISQSIDPFSSDFKVFRHKGILKHSQKMSYLSTLQDHFPITKWGRSQFWQLYSICNESLEIATTDQWSDVKATLLLYSQSDQAKAIFYFSGVATDFQRITNHLEYLNPLDKDGLRSALSDVFYRGGRYGRSVGSITRLLIIRRKSRLPIGYWLEPYGAEQQQMHLVIFHEATAQNS